MIATAKNNMIKGRSAGIVRIEEVELDPGPCAGIEPQSNAPSMFEQALAIGRDAAFREQNGSSWAQIARYYGPPHIL